MKHPFQCLLAISRTGGLRSHLLAAAGHKLYTYNPATGDQLSVWRSSVARDVDEAASEPPRKRQKKSPTPEGSPSAIKDVAEGKTIGTSRTTEANITKLASTTSGKHIVAVTGEDKSIRVLSLQESGKLEQLSKRWASHSSTRRVFVLLNVAYQVYLDACQSVPVRLP